MVRVDRAKRNCETRETLAAGRSCPELGGVTMKRALMAASVLAVFAGTQALAQTVGVGPAETVVIEPEQRTVIRDYVVKERVAPVTVKERISVGARLPADVELRTVPSTWGPKLSKYRYIYSGNQVYLVEPSNRTVVQIIE
jgi:hypothetical protein